MIIDYLLSVNISLALYYNHNKINKISSSLEIEFIITIDFYRDGFCSRKTKQFKRDWQM